MMITNHQMDRMHQIQMDILRQVIAACDALNLQWFFVHGSLLGAVTTGKFMPMDDDIDLAMPRKDYEILLAEGHKYIDPRYFIQAGTTDPLYPLSFAKVRDGATTYVAELLRNIPMHHGMFIDIFPMDFCPAGTLRRKLTGLRTSLLTIRISRTFAYAKRSKKTRLLQALATVLCPSCKAAIRRRDALYGAVSQGKTLTLTGGKAKEQAIPAQWFRDYDTVSFEGVDVRIPREYDAYLTRIYGNYRERTLLENKAHDDSQVEINACIWDPDKPYSHYV